MGFLEEKLKEIESEKTAFIEELEDRISRLKREGDIGKPHHIHFTVRVI